MKTPGSMVRGTWKLRNPEIESTYFEYFQTQNNQESGELGDLPVYLKVEENYQQLKKRLSHMTQQK